jgi:hypothetical protein
MSMPARYADTKMRKATRFVTRNEGERLLSEGTTIPERETSLAACE